MVISKMILWAKAQKRLSYFPRLIPINRDAKNAKVVATEEKQNNNSIF